MTIEEHSEETFRQQRRGGPAPDAVSQDRAEAVRPDVPGGLRPLAEAARCDGIFPLISNEAGMSAKDLLLAYKQQPMIEKRYAS